MEIPAQSTSMDILVKQIYAMTPTQRSRLCDDVGPEQFHVLTMYMLHHHDRLFKQKLHTYFITFTTTESTSAGSEQFLKTQAHRRALHVQDFMYTKEHADTNVHYHVLMRTTETICKQDFKQWINTRGHIDFKPVKLSSSIPDIISYMSKETEPSVVLGSFN